TLDTLFDPIGNDLIRCAEQRTIQNKCADNGDDRPYQEDDSTNNSADTPTCSDDRRANSEDDHPEDEKGDEVCDDDESELDCIGDSDCRHATKTFGLNIILSIT